jgi:large subunit ribosomal protein L23
MTKKPQPAAPEARHYDIVLAPHITEKSTMLSETNSVVFKVAPKATKPEIKAAVEALFGVHVTGVWTSNQRGKARRTGRTVGQRPNWKKAIVTLREGDTIPIFEA